jgi:glycosyl transferase family 25
MKAFIIRLKNNTISEKYADDCISQAAKFGVNVEYFDAVNGLEYQRHLEELQITPRYKFKKARAGVFGCFLSHYYLWKKCVEINEPLIILEHDGYFIRDLPTDILNRFMDVLKLDKLDPYSKSYDSDITSEQQLDLTISEYCNLQAKFLEKNQTGNYMRGAYSYIIKPHAAKKLLEWISTNGFVPADQQLGNAIIDIQVTTPTIARLHPAYSGKIKELSLTGNTKLL